MSNLDNYDLYKEDETTKSTNSLNKNARAEDELEEAYQPRSSSDPSPRNNNRVFMIALAVLAAIFIIAIIGMIIFASISLPQQQQARTQTAFAISMGNEATIAAATATQLAFDISAQLTEEAMRITPTDVVPTATQTQIPPTVTPTEIVVAPEEVEEEMAAEEQENDLAMAQTQTIAALLTQVAQEDAEKTAEAQQATPNAAQQTATAMAATLADTEALPDTGFLDGNNLALIAGSALVLIAVIIVARRLRKS